MFININNMVAGARQASSDASPTHLVLYDGVCALCNGLLQFLLAHDRRRIYRFASLQSPTGKAIVTRFGGRPDELTSLYVVLDYRTERARALTRSRAAIFILSTLGWPWTLARVIGVLPTVILDGLYDLVARSRYRIFGRYEQCLVPGPDIRDRFVD